MKKFTFFQIVIILLVAANHISAQEIIYANDKNITSPDENAQTSDQQVIKKDKSKISYNLEMGTSFSTSKYFGNAFTFYTSPSLKYKISPRLNISAGVLLMNSNIGNYYLSENQNKRNYNAYFMSGFDYSKERLKISGEIIYGMNKSPYNSLNSRNAPEYFVRFSAEYKITDNLSIGLQVINQNMNRGYLNSFGNEFYNPNRYYPYSGF
jgi:hypothetical protein